jgi:hypothetical protein
MNTATATERIPVLVTPAEKTQVAKLAKSKHISMGELFRRAVFADRYESEEDKITLALIEQVNASTKRANAVLDEAFKRIEASEKRNKALNARLA